MRDTDPTTRLTATAPDGAVHDLASPEAQAAIDTWVETEAESLLETARRWRTVGPHPAPGQDTPTHPGPGETCTDAACVKSRAQHEAAGRIQDLSYVIFDSGSVDGPANPEPIADTNDAR